MAPGMKAQRPVPTAEQCSARAAVEFEGVVGYAGWYPQMGGYVARCIVLPDEYGCFDVLVWHDGDFPFDPDGGPGPRALHHCDPDQFIGFGRWLATLEPPHKS